MAKINEQLQSNLSKVVGKIFTLATEKWVNAKDHPISGLCIEYNVDKRYSTAISKVLREKGLFFSEGEKSGMKYKISLNNDYFTHPFLVNLIIEQYRADVKAYNDSRKSDDCRPLRNKAPKMETLPATFIKRTSPHLGDKMFTLIFGRVFECEIVGKKYDRENKKILLFDIEVPEIDESIDTLVQNLPLNKLFESVETLTTYLNKHVVKFK